MKVISLNIGESKIVNWKNENRTTAIFKKPVTKSCTVSVNGIDGDQQADLKHHGGETKAIYSYDISYYEQWKKILHRDDWSHGMFGENLTTEGLPDNEVRIGNTYKVGSAIIKAMEPRFPCSKLNLRFNSSTMVKLFTQQKQNGIYFKVIEEGFIQANDTIELIEASPYAITINDIVECYYSKGKDKMMLKNILDIPYLPKGVRKNLTAFL